MKDLFKLILGVLALLFKSRAKLEAEILITRRPDEVALAGEATKAQGSVRLIVCGRSVGNLKERDSRCRSNLRLIWLPFLPRSVFVIGWNFAGPLKASAVDTRLPSSLTQVEKRSDCSPPQSLGTTCSPMISANAVFTSFSGIPRKPSSSFWRGGGTSRTAQNCRCCQHELQAASASVRQ